MKFGKLNAIKWLTLLLIGLQISSEARIIRKRDVPAQLFAVGSEYKYHYEVLVTTGTEVPISHAASYRIKGVLTVQGTSANTVTVKLEDLGIGLYNGQWSYFPVPSFNFISTDDLASLSLPFQIVSENGKFKTLIMNDQEPEWASNMKRGLATYLQMNLQRVAPQKLAFFKDEETTTMGVCPTTYEVLPITATGMGSARITKFRNHADCPDVPTRIRHETRTYYPCRDDKTRDILNSTSYAIYDLTVQGTKITAQKLTVLSSILYWPFTQNGPFLYSWYNMTLALNNVGPISTPISPPENSIDHEDLSYVFEQSDYSDPEDDINDLKGVEPLFFHQTSHDIEPEVVEKIMEKCHQTIADLAKSMMDTDVFNDYNDFHLKSPAAVIPLLSSLNYEDLTKCYEHYLERAKTGQQGSLEWQLFLDGLANSGTPASTLVIRDIILKSTQDMSTLVRLIMSYAGAIRHPSEALGIELDSILELANNPIIEPRYKSIIELSMANVISRVCEKSKCTSSGLLDKYIKYFEEKLTKASSSTEEKVLGVLGLGNIGIGKALEKPFSIAQGHLPQYENTVRVQCIWSLRPLILQQKDRVITGLLPVFFNRSETSEVRISVFSFLMGSRPDERVLHEIAYTMWSETCPQVVNAVVSTLNLMSKTEYPCNPVGSYARTVLKYIPGIYQQIDPAKSLSFALDYYSQNGFGRMRYVTVLRSGSSVLPLSIYVGYNSYIAGYSNSFFGFYLRLQGVEKLVHSSLPGITDGNVEKVIDILSKIEIDERQLEPLQIELVVMNNGKAIQYFAADASTIGSKLKTIITSLQRIKKQIAEGAVYSLQQPALTAGIRYQQPLEIGTPVSVFANLAGVTALTANATKTSGTQIEENLLFQTNLFATTGVTNHIPAINTMLSVSNYRTYRLRIPLHSTSSEPKTRPDALQFSLFVPNPNNPFIVMTHATSEVSLRGDHPSGIEDEKAELKLKESCPTCSTRKTVSAGAHARRDRQLSLPPPKLLRGVIAQIKYVDCERDHSKVALLKKLKSFFSESGKNLGHFSTSLAVLQLGLDQLQDTLFISPYGETCGFKGIFSQDASAKTQTNQIKVLLNRKSSKSPPKLELFSTIVLNHEGESPSETKIDFHAAIIDKQQIAVKQQQINIKGAVINGPSGQSGIMCFDIENLLNTNFDDPLGYTGQSDPAINQTFTLKIGKFSSGEPSPQSSVQDLPCLSNHAELTFSGSARRSSGQIMAADSNLPPYILCNADKASGLWPGKFLPPTRSCEMAMMEQTNLRSVNMTVCYKIAKEAKNRWAALGHLGSSFLSLYLLDSSEAISSDHDHITSHNHPTTSTADSANYLTGDVEINLNLQQNAPKMHLHYSKSDGEERHFHDVDLSLLPSAFVPDPYPARISPLEQIKRRFGVTGSCSISPSFVMTLDGWQYPMTLSSECSVLVSGDCSQSSQYAILARQMPNQQLAVIIQVQDTRIELQDPTTAVIDGALKTFRNFEEFGKDGKFLMYTRSDEIYVTFMSPSISVRYTGSFITVELGSMFRGVNCGVCGNWDGTPYNDMVGPKVCSRPLTPSEMVQSWTVREGQCTDVGSNCPEVS